MTEYNKVLMEVWQELGTHLTDSKEAPGFSIGVSRSDSGNAVVDLALMKEPDSVLKNLKPKDWALIAAGAAVLIAGTVIVTKQLEKMKQKKAREAELARKLQPRVLESIEIENAEQYWRSDLVESEGVKLTEEQWITALSRLLELEAFRDQMWNLLKSAQITDPSQVAIDWQKQLQRFSPKELAVKIKLVLDANPELLAKEDFEAMLRSVLRNNEGPDEIGAKV
jgi:hypothetical protein